MYISHRTEVKLSAPITVVFIGNFENQFSLILMCSILELSGLTFVCYKELYIQQKKFGKMACFQGTNHHKEPKNNFFVFFYIQHLLAFLVFVFFKGFFGQFYVFCISILGSCVSLGFTQSEPEPALQDLGHSKGVQWLQHPNTRSPGLIACVLRTLAVPKLRTLRQGLSSFVT